MFMEKIKAKFAPGKPIFVSDILALFPNLTKAYVYRLLKENENSGNIVRFSQGIYCLPTKSFLGRTTTTATAVADYKYVSDGERIYGIYSGVALLNQFAITSQVPNVLKIVTNHEATRKRMVSIDKMKFVLRKSRLEITKDNYSIYIILQLFSDLGANPPLNDFAKQGIKNYIQENDIHLNALIDMSTHFPARTIKNLMGSEVFNGTV